ncbi:hypothetical protein [Phenylobacterium immobile]|nr:hypothetical protein [Phenylobacterium immobile]
MDDKAIHPNYWEPGLDATETGVTVEPGVVSLAGRFDTCAQKVVA